MYNEEYPDLILEGLMYDLSIVEEGFKEGVKNAFKKIIAFLERIGNWFLKIFRKIAKLIPKKDIPEADLSTVSVNNYDTTKINEFIKNCSYWLKEVDNILIDRKKVDCDDSVSLNKYFNKLNDFFIEEKNAPLISPSYRNNMRNALGIGREKVKCTKEILNYIISSYEELKNTNINDSIRSYRNSFRDLNDLIFEKSNDYDKVKDIAGTDKRIMIMCNNLMNVSYDILDAFFKDLSMINTVAKDENIKKQVDAGLSGYTTS